MFKVMLIVVSFTISGNDYKITEYRDIKQFDTLEACESVADKKNSSIPEETPTVYLCERR